MLASSVQRLRQQLRDIGSDLIIRIGDIEEVLPALAQQLGATCVLTEQAVEHRWVSVTRSVQSSLAGSGTPLLTWQLPLWPAQNFRPDYREWRRKRGTPTLPLPDPTALAALPPGLDPGELPDGAALQVMLAEAATPGSSKLDTVARDVQRQQRSGTVHDALAAAAQAGVAPQQLLRDYLAADTQGWPEPLRGIADVAVAASERPGAGGASFRALFGAALSLGALSRRQVHHEAEQYERLRWGGRMPPTGPSTAAVVAALRAVEQSDFHCQLSASVAGSLAADKDGLVSDAVGPRPGSDGFATCCWRWRGVLNEYCVATPEGWRAHEHGAARPAILLVHGFGAFGSQWRGNLAALAGAGYRVFAPTIPGFGRSEKGALPYSQDLWRDFLRDFVLQEVRSPVVVAGNSIGGFIAASLAADYPDLVSGLLLLNSAGPIDSDFDPAVWAATTRRPLPAPVIQGISSALFALLEVSVSRTLKWLYPTNPAAADEWLEREIFRAAGDAGAIEVFRAGFYLPPPRALNWLVGSAYRGPVRVLQGAKDPLNDARGRALELQALCDNVDAVLLDAGHCPHDEVPDLVNAGILSFIEERVLGPPHNGPRQGSTAVIMPPQPAVATGLGPS